jgi:hypothetical protein
MLSHLDGEDAVLDGGEIMNPHSFLVAGTPSAGECFTSATGCFVMAYPLFLIESKFHGPVRLLPWGA